MNATETEGALKARLAQPLSQLTPRDGIAAMCSFYADMRIDGADISSDRDMLLYQWGVDSFNAPDTFQLNITRQLNVSGESQPYQLALIFNYRATDALKQINFGNQWCRSPGDLSAFRKFIESSAAFKAVADSKPDQTECKLERRG
jgi:hypothetical protein